MKQLLAALAAVQKDITPVEKKGRNEYHKYDYATEADFLAMIRPLLAKHGLVITSSVEGESNAGQLSKVSVAFTVWHVVSGESIKAMSVGYGQDAADKGVYKAMTGATKYFFAKFFQIPTGDDPEDDGGEVEKAWQAASAKDINDQLGDEPPFDNEPRYTAPPATGDKPKVEKTCITCGKHFKTPYTYAKECFVCYQASKK